MAGFMLNACPTPTEASPLKAADDLFPLRPLSMTLRRMLVASYDHVAQWPDLVTPTQVFEGQQALVSPRPVFSYARSGMEAAGVVAWVLESADIREGVARHQSLTHQDLGEQLKAYNSAGDSATAADVAQRIELLEQHAFGGKAPAKVPYVERVKAGARLAGLDEGRADYLWRLASAASHGQEWFYDDAFEPIAEPDGRGHRPRGEQMVEVLEYAAGILTSATFRFVENCGYEPGDALAQSWIELTETMPLKAGATPSSVRANSKILAALKPRAGTA